MDVLFTRLTQSAFGYWQAQPMFVLAKLGVFDLLRRTGPQTADQIVAALELHREAGLGVLHAAVALKLLRKDDQLFWNTELTERFLVSDSPETLIHWVRVMGRWARPWADLELVIRTGMPAELQSLRLGEDPEYLTDFILGMHEYARRYSRQFAETVYVADRRYLTDVGGGAGTYAIALCEANPLLRATVLDLEPVLAITRHVISDHGLQDRIDTHVADYRRDALGADPDVILLSNILHQEAPDVCRSILERAHRALLDDGELIIQGHFLAEDQVSPIFTTLHNLSALVLWHGGRSYTLSEMMALVAEAGFRDPSFQTMKQNAESLIFAYK